MEFAKAYGPGDRPQDVPWWSTTLELRGQQFHFAGLCSSWTSCSDEDYGNLLVGRWQVNEFLKGAKDADWSVALLHHPWAWLAAFDAEEVEAAAYRDCNIILRGHVHRQQSRAFHSPQDVCLELAAGSVFDGSRYSNDFQLVELEPDLRTVRIHFWLWREGRWIEDRNACPEAPDGVATFILDAPATAEAGTAQPRTFDSSKYLRALRERTAYIDIRGLQAGSGRAYSFPIDELYVPLTTSGGAERELRIELDEALRHHRLVIVGDPGAGKTTFLRRIAYLVCQDQLGENPGVVRERLGLEGIPFPILIRLSELAEHITVYSYVPHDNNFGERQIRPAVILRKNSPSNRSDRGAATQAVLMNVYRTLRLRGLNPTKTIADALKTYPKLSS